MNEHSFANTIRNDINVAINNVGKMTFNDKE